MRGLVPSKQDNSGAGQDRRRIAIFGATGSIGCSCLKVVRANPDRFQVVALSGHSRLDELVRQAAEFRPRYVIASQEERVAEVKRMLAAALPPGTKQPEVLAGVEGLNQVAASADVDTVVGAIVGIAGLEPVLSALRSGKRVALANKESLVAAGRLVSEIIGAGQGELVPVDSEHSAIFQALQAVQPSDLRKIILTASGGPFLDLPYVDFAKVTPQQAAKHPRWSMGLKISIDSATLMNKALEVIEAHWLFGVSARQIDVVVHPQSIVHSLIELRDGSQLAQLSVPDMCAPIAFALSYPGARLVDTIPALNLAAHGKLEFRALDAVRFPAIDLARQAIEAGGASACVLNSANEAAVAMFVAGELGFDKIASVARAALERFVPIDYSGVSELLEIDREVREFVRSGEF